MMEKAEQWLLQTRSFIRFSELESLSLDMIRWLVTCSHMCIKLLLLFVQVARDRGTLSLYMHRQL
jgi:hypothetical protein